MDNNKDLQNGTGALFNAMWQPACGGAFGGEWVRAYLGLNPFALPLKLSQHC